MNGITPTTVKTDRPGMSVSVIDGGPSKKVCSGAMTAAGDAALTFSLGCLDFFGLALDGFGLYAQWTGADLAGQMRAANSRGCGVT